MAQKGGPNHKLVGLLSQNYKLSCLQSGHKKGFQNYVILCCCFVECSVAVNKPKLKTARNSEALDSRGRRRGRSCGDAMFSDIRSLKTDGQM